MTLSDYLSLFPGASREKPRFMALAEAVLRQATDFLPVISALSSAFSLDSAAGVQLDILGASCGLSRADTSAGPEASDEVFRSFLQDKLLLWGWDGTNETVPDILNAILPGGTQCDNGDGTITLRPSGSLSAPAKDLFCIPAGVRAIT